MIRDTECFSINSDISRRIKLSGALNMSSASCLTSSVLPTPVLPTKMKLTGLCFGEMPTRLRRMAAATASMASSWPMIFFFSRWSSSLRRLNSSSRILLAGILVHSSMTRARLSMVSSGVPLAVSWSSSSWSWSSRLFSSARRSKLGSSAASRISRSLSKSAISRRTSWRRLMSLSWRFRSEQASSMRSMALSGRYRSVIYRSERITAWRRMPSGMWTPWKVS